MINFLFSAAFLIPYVTMLFVAGIPVFFMELSIGQYVSLGPAVLFPKMAPIFSATGDKTSLANSVCACPFLCLGAALLRIVSKCGYQMYECRICALVIELGVFLPYVLSK
ncbi:Sodium-dependent proline transporter [Portunus trituberculatus]|uniref:Sodium-dependent proline transporter n=1 Tax=Portunus trituberculatus TaxID=210409 RepID=A0A5B7GK78_PORTR|nr:Sodium-dependent proline transporter [Portunus trituberculatus]